VLTPWVKASTAWRSLGRPALMYRGAGIKPVPYGGIWTSAQNRAALFVVLAPVGRASVTSTDTALAIG